jgi:hypothetical protein
MSKFYAVLFNFQGRAVPTEQIEQVLTAQTSDWMRFTAGQYVVQYDASPRTLYDALKPVTQTGENVLIFEAELNNRSGWASNVVVDWLNKHRP